MINDFLIDYLNEECNAGLCSDVALYDHTVSGNNVIIVITIDPNDMYCFSNQTFNVGLLDLMAFIYNKVKQDDCSC